MRADRLASARARERIGRAVHRIDHALGRALGRLRVLVDVRTPMNAAVLRPVWSALAQDPRITLAFSAEQEEPVRASLAADGQSHALMSRAAAARARWDLVLTADAWNHTPVRRCRRCMQFFHGVAGKYDLDAPQQMASAGLDRFDRVAFINQDRLERYVTAGAVTRERAVLVGYPKADDLVNGRWSRESVRQSLGLDVHRHTVTYAPTFSTSSSLHLAGLEIVRALLEDDLNVIVKLHDRSMIADPHHTNGIDWPQQLSRFATHRGFALAAGADAEPYLAAADLLVTDHSTVGFEFALLDRPIVVYDAPHLLQAARIDSGKWHLLRSMATVAATPGDLTTAVREALAEPWRRTDERRRARELFAWPGSATDRATAVVYELLEIAPLTSAHPRPSGAWAALTGVGR